MAMFPLRKAAAAVAFSFDNLTLPAGGLDLHEHLPAVREAHEVLAERFTGTRWSPDADRKAAALVQEVADFDLGERLVALPSAVAQPGKKAVQFSILIDEPQPTLVFVRDAIARSLNTRPRKRLGYQTPEECFYGK